MSLRVEWGVRYKWRPTVDDPWRTATKKCENYRAAQRQLASYSDKPHFKNPYLVSRVVSDWRLDQ